MRYVILPENPTVANIDAALRELTHKRKQVKLEIIRGWISEDITTLLEMRYELDLTEKSDALGSQPTH